MKLIEWLLDLIYPPRCILCHKILDNSRQTACTSCMDNLPEHDGADPRVRFAERCVATFFYEEPVRGSIHRFKFSGQRQYAAQYGKWMAVTIGDKLAGKFDLISWVPVGAARYQTRGYDQAELLARSVADVVGVPVIRTLVKGIENPAQSSLQDAAQRAANVRGVYQPVEPERFRGKRLLLIDDVVTTGSTLAECCRVLLTAGAECVVCAALATPRKDPEGKGEQI